VINLKRLINLGLEHDGTTWNLAPSAWTRRIRVGPGQTTGERHLRDKPFSRDRITPQHRLFGQVMLRTRHQPATSPATSKKAD
jgi:hypothetical protein